MNKQQILASLDKTIYGHRQAKIELINLFERVRINHFQRVEKGIKTHEDGLIKHRNLFLIGKSGTGKSYLVEQLEKLYKLPVYKIDATQLTITGASDGIKLKDLIKSLNTFAKEFQRNNPLHFPSWEGALQQTIVFIDEFDKLALDSSEGWNQRVQTNFLRLFERKVESCEHLSFIFAGSFMGSDIHEPTVKKHTIGFFKEANAKDESNHIICEKELLKAGIIPEIAGRVDRVVKLDSLSIDDYRNILTEKIIPSHLKELKILSDKEFNIEDDKIEEIVKQAYESEQGIRSLYKLVSELTADIEFESNKYDFIRL